MLNKIDGWYWDSNENIFYEGIDALKKYYKIYNTSYVRDDYVDENKFKLGQCCALQRRKKDKIDKDKLIEFEQFHDWVWEKSLSQWEHFYSELLSFYEKNNNLDVDPQFKTSRGMNLYNWMTTQRLNFKSGSLEKVKIKKLEN